MHGFIWPDTQSQTAAIHDSCCAHLWKQNKTCSTDPWQDHTHFGHPAAVVLAVSDGMDDLEVAFQGDDYQTELFGGQANSSKRHTFKEHANYVVKYTLSMYSRLSAGYPPNVSASKSMQIVPSKILLLPLYL